MTIEEYNRANKLLDDFLFTLSSEDRTLILELIHLNTDNIQSIISRICQNEINQSNFQLF